jgi:hypothetical protein
MSSSDQSRSVTFASIAEDRLQDHRNPSAVALGKLGGAKGGKARAAKSVVDFKLTHHPKSSLASSM